MAQIAFNHYIERGETPPIDKLFDIEFERQFILHGWIVDFFFPQIGLVIEVDGKYHESSKQSDFARDMILLQKYGIQTMRFTTDEIYIDGEVVIEKIASRIFDYLFEIEFEKHYGVDNGEG